MPERRFPSAVRYALSIGGVHAAWPVSFEGGDAVGDVVEVADGSDPVVRKHLGGVRYPDIALQCGPDMSAALLDWMQASLSGKLAATSGSVSAVDAEGKEVWRLDFSDALISEITVPALDGSSKTAATLGLRLAPASTRRHAGSGVQIETAPSKARKAWLAANFRLTIDGLDSKRVTRIEPLVVRISPSEETGEHRIPRAGQPRIDVQNLVVMLAGAGDATWRQWHEDFVISGNNGPDRERAGTLELLAPDGSAVLQVGLRGLGIVSVGLPRSAGLTEAASVVRAELYCEEVTLAMPV